jgi:acyl carrier protein phosphodiesterase
MNFLAHAYLSFGDPEILIGNMIADMVKGRQIELYPERVQQGIHVHRQIDRFTDIHPVNTEAVNLFRDSAKKYAGVFLDVSYDHFLALDSLNEPSVGWKNFATDCYNTIARYEGLVPPHFSTLFRYMKREDWLYNYRKRSLIKRSFRRLKQRASYLDRSAPVFADFEHHYAELQQSYNAFFPELKEYVEGIKSQQQVFK